MRAWLSFTTVCAAGLLALACADDDASPTGDEQGSGSDSSSDGTTEAEDEESSTFSSETMSESSEDSSESTTEEEDSSESAEDSSTDDTSTDDTSTEDTTEESDTNCPPGTFGCPCDQGLCEDPFVCADGICQLPTEDNCGDIQTQYDALIEASNSCTDDADCQWLYGHCGVGLGECYTLVNLGVDQGDFDALAALWEGASCSGPVCDCPPPPASVPCVDNVCAWP